jgi:4-cresol dehydrogenase (hydroxylating)
MYKPAAILLPDIGEFKAREIVKILYPASIEELKEIVKEAIVNKTPLYPVSTGKNWGFGSTQPVLDNTILVNLSRINTIREINLNLGYAVIETGVTQADLYHELKNSAYMLNVTRSIAETSIAANTLERGLGSIRQRCDDLLALEFITGNGELLRTGSFWSAGDAKCFHSHGIGPNLTPLFLQSNLGITTAIAIKLHKRSDYTLAIEFDVDETKILDLLASIKDLVRKKIFFGLVRIFNNESSKKYNFAKDNSPRCYKLIGSLAGDYEIVQYHKSIITRLLADLAMDGIKFSVLDESTQHPEYKSYLGIPDTDSIKEVFSVADASDLDKSSKTGLLSFMPVLPLDEQHLAQALQLISTIEKCYDIKFSMTINLVNDMSLYLSIFCYFERQNSDAVQIHLIFQKLKQSFMLKGYYPYRLDVDSHTEEYFQILQGDNTYRDYLKKIKQTMDSNNIIAPTRYIK